MRDADLRGMILRKLYDARHEPSGYLQTNDLRELAEADVNQIANVCDHLRQKGLIVWKDARGPAGPAGLGKITSLGVDVIEGTADSPIPIKLIDNRSQHIHISQSHDIQIAGGNAIANSFDIEKINAAIDRSSISERQKEEARSAFKTIANIPGLLTFIFSFLAPSAAK